MGSPRWLECWIVPGQSSAINNRRSSGVLAQPSNGLPAFAFGPDSATLIGASSVGASLTSTRNGEVVASLYRPPNRSAFGAPWSGLPRPAWGYHVTRTAYFPGGAPGWVFRVVGSYVARENEPSPPTTPVGREA